MNKRPNSKKNESRTSNIPRRDANVVRGKTIIYKPNMKVSEVAEGLGISNAEIIKKLMMLGVMTSVNQSIDRDTIELISEDMGFKIQDEVITDITRFDEMKFEDAAEDLVKRAPIVTIMGHVDHGKTTLLDTIRHTRVVAGEAGGITQHIGAYQVERNGEKITFIDTPGHAAFTEMRARGAKVTDLCILVVAADDGVMPQTVEALEHAKAAQVPIIVAVNKMDKPQANPELVMTELSNLGLIPEAWGGNTPYVEVSALKGKGIDTLLDVIQLVSEIEDLKANPNRLASGTVIEARLDKGRGIVTTVIVTNGTLKVGDNVVAGNTYGKIRTMNDDTKRRYDEAIPGQPVEITGLFDMPEAGDIFVALSDERQARQIAEERQARQREGEMAKQKKASLKSMMEQAEAEQKELVLIIKGDTQGSIEALKGSLEKLDIEGLHVNVIRSSVGAITESDVSLASASNAIIIGFNVRPTSVVREFAKSQGVEVRLYNIIYKAIEDIEAALTGMLAPEFEEVVTGQAEVRSVFRISKVGAVAGCYVTDGVIERNSLVRVIREGIVVYEGKMASLKRFKDDAKEVKAGYECGISIENFNDIKEGDIMEASIEKEVERG
ncbi:translation initiation factor IF-2 [Paracholeplasma manati]|jgi:translation initiation factor IF-2|uniref:Translation initiation factor IF-2 n=1 Tax=Paracholeplasma manati TaxID=591373 RepID=A0ABT2Y6P2_9MOLU|nr:translation initiation factor IF-2 [Paracholeplasma manati]MCV2232411.1 translation initiation factor IF-2 [Paracholeplasma manati]MDG0888003.1 translation initiation factor IF-2 [Paracholeplasma manati]MDX9807647.1 translation initiation factor IF-2 [Acholeplasma sp.]